MDGLKNKDNNMETSEHQIFVNFQDIYFTTDLLLERVDRNNCDEKIDANSQSN